MGVLYIGDDQPGAVKDQPVAALEAVLVQKASRAQPSRQPKGGGEANGGKARTGRTPHLTSMPEAGVRPNTSGEYISSARAGFTRKLPRATALSLKLWE